VKDYEIARDYVRARASNDAKETARLLREWIALDRSESTLNDFYRSVEHIAPQFVPPPRTLALGNE